MNQQNFLTSWYKYIQTLPSYKSEGKFKNNLFLIELERFIKGC